MSIARKIPIAFGLAALISAVPLPGDAQTAPPPAPSPVAASEPLGGGLYPAVMEVDPGLPTHTIYHPGDLNGVGTQKLPVVIWGNGACANAGNRFRWFLSEISSYGYFVIAVGPIQGSDLENGTLPFTRQPVYTPSNPPSAAGLPPPATRTPQLIDAMNWAVAENEKPASKYYHRLDTAKIAVMGQSCGGVQAIEASADPRVKTTMVWNSGLFPRGTDMAGGKVLTKDDLRSLHAPVAYISGDDEDVAFLNANDDVEKLQNVPVFRGYERGVLHGGTYRDRNGGEFAGIGVAWLNWQLKGDQRSALMFKGPGCGLCVNPRWVVKKKGIN